jgi:hypothetical protein
MDGWMANAQQFLRESNINQTVGSCKYNISVVNIQLLQILRELYIP